MTDNAILMGVVGRPHGVRGLCHVHSYTTDPSALAAYSLHDSEGRAWTLAWTADGVARLTDASGKPVGTRNEAEKLVNLRLYAARDALPAVEEEEFYLADLIGLAARGDNGSEIGKIVAVHDHGGGAYLEISKDGAVTLVPFTRAAVPVVDLAAKFAVIVPPHEIIVRPEDVRPEDVRPEDQVTAEGEAA